MIKISEKSQLKLKNDLLLKKIRFIFIQIPRILSFDLSDISGFDRKHNSFPAVNKGNKW
jgi:hypothetical protein